MERAGGVTLVVLGLLLMSGLWDHVMVSLRPLVAGFTPAI